jgi:A/G-specific adenine glycosylase
MIAPAEHGPPARPRRARSGAAAAPLLPARHARQRAAAAPSLGGPAPERTLPDATRQRAAIWAALQAWYAVARRDLPWRRTRDPYAIVVAEFMLQQTQVDRVTPKYRAFLAAFPTWQALAAAGRADVVRAWAGLGYNRRAVWLHELARLVVERYGGALPADMATLEKLPGLGPYTAAAVACFAFDQHVPLVDTNVRRVLGRLFMGCSAVAPPTARTLAAWALPPEGAADWHQALMDLGATICLARRPACARCPVATWCVARPRLAEAASGRIQMRRVAEQRASYGEPYVGSRRYYRGRVVEVLRALAPGEAVDLATLGAQVKPGYRPANTPWLCELVGALVADGLVEWVDDRDEMRVRLAGGGQRGA